MRVIVDCCSDTFPGFGDQLPFIDEHWLWDFRDTVMICHNRFPLRRPVQREDIV